VLQCCLAGIDAAQEPLQQLLALAIEDSAASGWLLLWVLLGHCFAVAACCCSSLWPVGNCLSWCQES
jgi:hypothetical protein